jgi:hypothetical protein
MDGILVGHFGWLILIGLPLMIIQRPIFVLISGCDENGDFMLNKKINSLLSVQIW